MIIEEVLVQEGVCREPVGRFVVYPEVKFIGDNDESTIIAVYRSGDERGAMLRELLDEVVLAE